MTLRYGIFAPQGWRMELVGINDPIEAYETMTRVAQHAEALNYDAIWLYDHMHTFPTPSQEVTFECWTSTAALARDTKRIRIGQLVTCNSYRNPALLAKIASTVDVLSHGRLTFGIGAGWYEHEYHAYGYDYPDGPVRLKMLEEALQVILAMWTQEEAHFEGKYYQVKGAINQPKGVQRPHIPILVAGGGEKVTLKLVAKYANACNFGNATLEELRHKFSVLEKHCENVGRNFNEIKRTAEYVVNIAPTEEQALAKALANPRKHPTIEELRERTLTGTPAQIRQRLLEIEDTGVEEVQLFFQDVAQLTPLELFAEQVIR